MKKWRDFGDLGDQGLVTRVTGDISKVITPSNFKVIEVGRSKGEKDINPDEMIKYEKHVNKKKKEEGTTLNDTEKAEKNVSIPQMSIFSTGVSRIIKGQYGNYQIVNFKDIVNKKGTLSGKD